MLARSTRFGYERWAYRAIQAIHRLLSRDVWYDRAPEYLTEIAYWVDHGGRSTRRIARKVQVVLTKRPELKSAPVAQKAKSPHARGAKAERVLVLSAHRDRFQGALFELLRALRLDPVGWDEAVRRTGSADPFIGEVVDAAFGYAQAVVALLTRDDFLALNEAFWQTGAPDADGAALCQTTPGFLFAVGATLGAEPTRTIIVTPRAATLSREPERAGGRRVVRLSGDVRDRSTFADILEWAQCAVDRTGDAWRTAGDFT
jgi:hypothetical protein